MESDVDWDREERLTAVVRAAGYEQATVFLSDPDAPEEGAHNYGGFGGKDVEIFVAPALSDPEAEATAFHELAHVELGHDDDPDYVAARNADQAAHTDHARGPWEVEADALAAALVESVASAMTDPARSMEFLAEDAARFV